MSGRGSGAAADGVEPSGDGVEPPAGTAVSAPGGTARPARRVVISSVTGRPIDWHGQDAAAPAPAPPHGETPKVLPDRVAEDAPEPGADESNDARLSQDVPPHWGR